MPLESMISRFKNSEAQQNQSKEQVLVNKTKKLKAELRLAEKEIAKLDRMEARLLAQEEKKNLKTARKDAEDQKVMSRRSFLKTAAIAGIGMAVAGPSKVVSDILNKTERPPAASSKTEIVTETAELEPVTTEIAQSAEEEVAKCREIIEQKCYQDVLRRPCLVSALYYSNESLDKMAPPHDTINEEIIWNIQPLVKKDFREGFIRWIKEAARLSQNKLGNEATIPLKNFSFGQKLEENHLDAIDLFAEEGSPVLATSSGIVILAESGWDGKNELATSSFRGGNSVIIFNPKDNSFERYVHLETMNAKPGTIIKAGTKIGTIGHTGQNASLPGHGKHLHFEINRYDSNLGAMVPTDVFTLKNKLESLA